MLAVLFLFLAFLFLPFGVEGAIFYVEGNYEVMLLVWFFTPAVSVRIMLGPPAAIPTSPKPVYREIFENSRLLLENIDLLKRLVDLVSLVNLKFLEIEADIGLPNPALTGIFIGGLWSTLAPLMLYLQEKDWPIDAISWQINPVFERESVNIFLRCIFTFSLGKILIGYLLLILKNKGRTDYGRASY